MYSKGNLERALEELSKFFKTFRKSQNSFSRKVLTNVRKKMNAPQFWKFHNYPYFDLFPRFGKFDKSHFVRLCKLNGHHLIIHSRKVKLKFYNHFMEMLTSCAKKEHTGTLVTPTALAA